MLYIPELRVHLLVRTYDTVVAPPGTFMGCIQMLMAYANPRLCWKRIVFSVYLSCM